MTTRISARLDTTSAQKLEYLVERTRSSTTEILKRAIDLFYQKERRQRPKAAKILAATGFIASGAKEADPNLSTDARDFGVYRFKNHHPFENLLLR